MRIDLDYIFDWEISKIEQCVYISDISLLIEKPNHNLAPRVDRACARSITRAARNGLVLNVVTREIENNFYRENA